METKMTTEALINDTRKAELLSTEVEHIDIKSFDARPIVEAMKKMSFTSRDLGRATEIYNKMLSDPDCSIVLVVAGSTSAGGCMALYADRVTHDMVAALVARAAPIVDIDFFEGIGTKYDQVQGISDDQTSGCPYHVRPTYTHKEQESL